MKPFRFEQWLDEGLHTYQYVAREGPVVERNWPGLFEEWPERGPTPFTEYAVNNNNCEEIAVYLGLIWRLTKGLLPYAVPRYDRDLAMYAAGAPAALVDWEYEVRNEANTTLGQIRGFVPARSSVRLYPPPTIWQKENSARAGLFELPVFSMFVRNIILADASAELNMYALKRQSVEKVIEALRGTEPPRVIDLLDDTELFIDLSIGVDHPEYHDILVVHSRRDLSDKLLPLVSEYETAIERYEADVEQIGDMDEFLSNIEELLNLGEELHLSR